MQKVVEWDSKEINESAHITLSRLGSSKIAEIEYVSILDVLSVEHKQAKGAKAKREVANRYKEAAQEINKNYKHPIYNSEI